MSWCRIFQCFPCCRKNNRVDQDPTIIPEEPKAPRGPQPTHPEIVPPILELPSTVSPTANPDSEIIVTFTL